MRLYYFLVFTLVIGSTAVHSKDKPECLIAFAAKGTDVGIDGGFMRAAYQSYQAIHDGKVVVSGSSSGAIMAAIFGCHGVTPKGFQVMDATLKVFDKKKIDMDEATITKAIFAGQGDKVYQPQSNLDEIIATITDGGRCVPGYPMVITAANQEVLDRRQHIIGTDYTVPFVGSYKKRLEMSNYAVFDHSMITGWESYRGRACTYFVDKTMYAALSKVPSDERLCDLRLIQTRYDLELAIRASVSEPTYFSPIIDSHPEQILPATYTGYYPPSIRYRVYNGGYPMTIVAQDIKRAMPDLYAFGTGRTYFDGGSGFVHSVQNHLGFNQSNFIQKWFMMPINEAIDRQRWWLDAEIPYNDEEWAEVGAATTTVAQNLDFGYLKAMQCIDGKVSCLPAEGMKPAYAYDATGTIAMSTKVRRSLSSLKRRLPEATAR